MGNYRIKATRDDDTLNVYCSGRYAGLKESVAGRVLDGEGGGGEGSGVLPVQGSIEFDEPVVNISRAALLAYLVQELDSAAPVLQNYCMPKGKVQNLKKHTIE